MSGRFEDYELLEELGRGAVGVVHKARHRELDRLVAIKLLQLSDTRGLSRFAGEAQAVARLQHPHIVPIHEAQLEGPRPFLAMGFIAGESLQQRLEDAGPLPIAKALGIADQLAQALAHAHGAAILHRDLKPANVLLGDDGRAYLTDFGLAKDLASSVEDLTRTGQIVGTPAFMAPEQACGERDQIGPATDVYGLGATLYAMLTGRPPHEGDSLIEVVAAVTRGTPRPLRALRPEASPGLEAVVLRCLARSPADRYPDIAALRVDLRRVAMGRTPEALPRHPRPRWALPLLGLLVAGGVVAGVLAARRGGAAAAPAPAPDAPTTAPSSPGAPPPRDDRAARAVQLRRGLGQPRRLLKWAHPTWACAALVHRDSGQLLAMTESKLAVSDDAEPRHYRAAWSIPTAEGAAKRRRVYRTAPSAARVFGSHAAQRIVYMIDGGRMLVDAWPEKRTILGHTPLGTWLAAAPTRDGVILYHRRLDGDSLLRLGAAPHRWPRKRRALNPQLWAVPGERYVLLLDVIAEDHEQLSLTCETPAGRTEGARSLRAVEGQPYTEPKPIRLRPRVLPFRDGTTVAVVEGERIQLLRVPTLTVLRTLETGALTHDLIENGRGDRLYVIGWEPEAQAHTLCVWSLGPTPTRLARVDTQDPCWRVALAPTTETLFVASQAGVTAYDLDLPR